MAKFVFIIPSYNNADWFRLNLFSVIKQSCEDWRAIYIDDCSSDGTLESVLHLIDEEGVGYKFEVLSNERRLGPAGSRHRGYQMADDDEICCMLDGDDWLFDKHVLSQVDKFYSIGYNATCGGHMIYQNGNILASKRKNLLFPNKKIPSPIQRKKFVWERLHFRTMRASLLKGIPPSHLSFEGDWIKCCSDVAESLYVLENKRTRIARMSFPTYVYNKDNSVKHEWSYYRSEFSEYKRSVLDYLMGLET